jgi:hypothetical protein
MTGRGRAALSVPIALGVVAALASTASGSTLTTGASHTTRPATPLISGSWQKLPPAPITQAPTQGLAVWTGSKMIVYGIRVTPSVIRRFNVAYQPGINAWQPLARGPVPTFDNNRDGGNVAAWTGSEMLVLGPTDGAYNPASDAWRPTATGGPGPTDGAVTGWTGTQVLVWGGVCCAPSNSGLAYDVASDTWTAIPDSPLGQRAFPAGAWTGKELIVAGGVVKNADGTFTTYRNGAAYNPATGTWRTLPLMPRPRYGAHAIWDGTEVLFLGGHRAPGTVPATDGMAYNPGTDTWRMLPAMLSGRDRFAAVWTGHRVLVYGGVTGRQQDMLPGSGEAYNPTTNLWTALPASPLHGRADPLAVWTGRQMIVWGGDFNNIAYTDGAAFTPRTP